MRDFVDRSGKIFSIAIQLTTSLGAVVLLALALISSSDVLTTRILNRPIPGVLKLSEAGLVLILFLGLAAATRSRRHVRVDLLINRLGPSARRFCVAMGYLCTAGFFALWTWQMGFMAAQSWAIRETATGLLAYPLYPIKSVLFLGMLFATLESFRRLVGSVNESFTSKSLKRRG